MRKRGSTGENSQGGGQSTSQPSQAQTVRVPSLFRFATTGQRKVEGQGLIEERELEDKLPEPE